MDTPFYQSKLSKALFVQVIFSLVLEALIYYLNGGLCLYFSIGSIIWYLVIIAGCLAVRLRSPCLLIFNSVINTVLSGLLIFGVSWAWVRTGFSFSAIIESHNYFVFIMAFLFLMILVAQWMNIKYSCLLARSLTRSQMARDEEASVELDTIQTQTAEEAPQQSGFTPVYYVVHPQYTSQFYSTNAAPVYVPMPTATQ
eukprot:TRINITY_DN218_c0_g2_i1.p1 TRINITY_DN218_c0_g2~~TRINITY_DN218_c0_g2_i1.p1  ORF type:complete len:227 (+),score=40.11 TRINITY_DN218_c0_g2_i1:90-683(+)